MTIVIDNYDSFTYNLVQYLGELGEETDVVRNDSFTLAQLRKRAPASIVISPGPCTPREAGLSVEVVSELGRDIPILGVCLGHQCIGSAFGGKIVRAAEIVHGKTSSIHHSGRGVFHGIPTPFTATRYHSLVIQKESVPSELEVTAWTEDGVIMGVQHKRHMIFGVQFHPESFSTEYGKNLLQNFLSLR